MVQRKVIVRGATDQALDELDAADIPDLAATYEAAGGITTHAADTSSVHGITDTTVLATDAEVATAVTNHEAAANPHATYLTQAEGDAAYEAAGGIATHAAAADPHAGYRLESADHSHATTGLQGGTVAHTALTSVGVDDHHTEDHDHDGSPTQKLTQANSHESPDTDVGPTSLHHTLGAGANQAATGDHAHAGGSPLYAPGTFTVPTGNFKIMADLLELTGVEVGTLEGTAVLALI